MTYIIRRKLKKAYTYVLKRKGGSMKSNHSSPRHLNIIVNWVLIILCLNLWLKAYAEVATEAEMEQVCHNWLKYALHQRGSWANSIKPEILSWADIYNGETWLARSFSIYPQGYILVPILKELTPVVAYSESSTLDADAAEGVVVIIKEQLSIRYRLFINLNGGLESIQSTKGSIVFNPRQRYLWDEFSRPDSEFVDFLKGVKGTKSEVGPLLTSAWHQGFPYWNNCPPTFDGYQTVVGCIATSTSQILNYWQWPLTGYVDFSYPWNGDTWCGGAPFPQVVTADLEDEFDWANMANSCTSGCTAVEQEAVAELCFEVGALYEMRYGTCVSWTGAHRALSILPHNLKYSPEIRYERRINYGYDDWFALIQEELDNGRPILYNIGYIVGGHSVVVDGYRYNEGVSNEYHVNNGWVNSSYNTWYIQDELYCYWLPNSLCPYEEEFMFTHIYPHNTPDLSVAGYSLVELSGNMNGRGNAGETVALTVTVNNGAFEAHQAAGILTSDDLYLTITENNSTFNSNIGYNEQGMTVTPFEIQIDESCPDPHIASCVLTTTAEGEYETTDSILIFIGDTRGFSEDCENGEGNWQHKNLTISYSDQWHLETARFHSGTTSWKFGGEGTGDYENIAEGCLISPPFLLPQFNATLSLWHRIDAEDDDTVPGNAFDAALVMIAATDGNWHQISPDGGYPFTLVDRPANPMESELPCYSSQNDWIQETFDISEYSGVARLMFRFASDAINTGEGWYIDDIEVTGNNFICGDANSDGGVNIGDAVYLINFVFHEGNPPEYDESGDVNCDGNVNIGDAVYLGNVIFRPGSPEPCVECPQ